MILICPSCQTRYYTTDSAVGATGRNVRCAACNHSWFAKPPETLNPDMPVQDESGLTRAQVERLRQKAAENAEGRTGPHAEYRELDRKRRKRNRILAASAAWAGGAVMMALTVTGLIVGRGAVVEAWPKSASFYKMAGMDVNRFGLDFTDLQAQRSFDGTTPILTISGKAQNVSEKDRTAPRVRIDLLNEEGAPVHSETVTLRDEVIPPGAETMFSLHIISPPMESFRLEASFEPKLSEKDSGKTPGEDHDAGGHGDGHADEAYAPAEEHAAAGHEPAAHGAASHDDAGGEAAGHDAPDHGDAHHGEEASDTGHDTHGDSAGDAHEAEH